MAHVNVEIKAACSDADAARRVLRAQGAEFRGADRQVDTYFRVPAGRLKLREGRIENHLIHYHRRDEAGPKRSDVLLMPTPPGPETDALKRLLTEALGVRVVVAKRREIYFLDNVKLHLDVVDRLGSFVEIEAQGRDGDPPADVLHEQCRRCMALLAIREEDLVAESYSDLLMRE